MFQKILVPLDGTEMSEGILPYVTLLSKALGSKVLLFMVLETYQRDWPERFRPRSRESNRESVQANETGANKKLSEIASRMGEQGVDVEFRLTSGKPAEQIVEVARQENCDVIAMSTHGRTALGRSVLGSVTDKVIHTARLPVLAITPEKATQYHGVNTRISKVMVPLDGSSLAEEALAYVEHLAANMSLEVLLVHVMNLRGVPASYLETHPYEGWEEMERDMEADALHYLEGVAERLKSQNVVVETKLLRGAAAVGIVDLARERPQDIIALATHGRSGIRRWILGSVAEAVIRASGDPVLVIPPNENQ